MNVVFLEYLFFLFYCNLSIFNTFMFTVCTKHGGKFLVSEKQTNFSFNTSDKINKIKASYVLCAKNVLHGS